MSYDGSEYTDLITQISRKFSNIHIKRITVQPGSYQVPWFAPRACFTGPSGFAAEEAEATEAMEVVLSLPWQGSSAALGYTPPR